MDFKTVIEKLLTIAPPGAVVEKVEIYSDLLGVNEISDIWYDEDSKSIVIQED